MKMRTQTENGHGLPARPCSQYTPLEPLFHKWQSQGFTDSCIHCGITARVGNGGIDRQRCPKRSDYVRAGEIESRFELTPQEAACLNYAMEQIATFQTPSYSTTAEAIQKEALRCAAPHRDVSMSRIADMKLCRELADIYFANVSRQPSLPADGSTSTPSVAG